MGTGPSIASTGGGPALPAHLAVLDSPLRVTRPAPMDQQRNDTDMRIWQVVMSIPPGKVATYGDVARMAGLPGAARRVGRALRGLPEDTRIPWHRVINAQGRIVIPGGRASRNLQRERLLREGVAFRSPEAVKLRAYRWQPD